MIPVPRQHLLRNLVAGVLLLLALYAAAGFWLVPRLIDRALHAYVEIEHQRHLQLGAVRFNPFNLRLDAERFAVPDADGKPLLSFDHLMIDVQVVSVLRGGLDLASVTLEGPRVHLVLRHDGSLNINDLLPPSDPKSTNPKSTNPKIWIHALAVSNGEAEFSDQTQTQPFELALKPVSFTLHEFSTRSEANAYSLSARSSAGETLDWRGTFGLEPFVSEGSVRIGALQARSIAAARPGLLPIGLSHGTFDLAGRYHYVTDDHGKSLHLDFSEISGHDLGLRAPGEQDSWVEIPRIVASDISVDVGAATARVARLAIERPVVHAWRERDGSFNIARLYAAPPAARRAGAVTAGPPGRAWQVAAPDVKVVAADVDFVDHSPATAAGFHVAPLDISVGGFASPAAQPLAVEIQAVINESGKLVARGTLALAPLTGRLSLDVGGFALQALQPYVEGYAALRLRSGTAGFHGTTFLAADGSLGLDGDGVVDALRTTDTALDEDFIKWRSVRFSGLQLRSRPVSLKIAELRARQPYARVIIGANGKTNLSEVLQAGRSALPPAATGVPAAAPKPEPVTPVEIGVVRIDDGLMNFADYSVKPQFATGIQQLSGTIRGLSSRTDSRAELKLAGQVDRYAPVTIEGQVNFLAATHYAGVRMSFKNMELTGMSPYSGKFAGYWIDKGKLSADLDYKIQDRRLNANHHIVVSQLQLGGHVDSPEATSLPVRLAVALLKDGNGVIDLDLPVTGSLDDPDFRVGKIVWQLFINLLTKTITSPFRLLGALFGGGEELEYLDFAAGDGTLDAATRAKVATLLKALGARPGLSVDVPMGYDAGFDGPALLERNWQAELASLATRRLSAAASDPAAVAKLLATPAARRALLEKAYEDGFGRKAEVPAAAPGAPPEAAAATATAWLEQQLKARHAAQPGELEALGAARAGAVQSALLEGTGLDPGRVFMVKAAPQSVKDDRLRLQLALH